MGYLEVPRHTNRRHSETHRIHNVEYVEGQVTSRATGRMVIKEIFTKKFLQPTKKEGELMTDWGRLVGRLWRKWIIQTQIGRLCKKREKVTLEREG